MSRRPLLGYGNLAVIVAVRAVGSVEVPRDKVVGVISMGDHFMAATCSMLVRCIVRSTTMRRGARVGICARDVERVLVDVAIVSVMHMPVVQVVDMPGVLNLRVSTVSAVRVIVLLMNRMCHDFSVASTQVHGKNTPLACKFASPRCVSTGLYEITSAAAARARQDSRCGDCRQRTNVRRARVSRLPRHGFRRSRARRVSSRRRRVANERRRNVAFHRPARKAVGAHGDHWNVYRTAGSCFNVYPPGT